MMRSSTSVRTMRRAVSKSGKVVQTTTASSAMPSGVYRDQRGLAAYPAATEDFIAAVADSSLAGSDVALRRVQADARTPIGLRLDRGRGAGMTVANLDGRFKRFVRVRL